MYREAQTILTQCDLGLGRLPSSGAPSALLLGVLFVLAACGAAHEPTSPASTPSRNAAPAPVPTTAPSDTPSAPPDAPSVPAVTPVPSVPAVTPRPAQCRGSSIELDTVISDEACMVGADFATPVAAPDCAVLSVEPAKPMVKRGAWAALRVIFENRSDAPCSLVFRFRPSFFLGFMGEPVPRTTGGFGVETRSFLGDSSLDDPPGPVALGALLGENRELIEVELEPHGRAVATVNWQAVGFLPGKRYRPRRDASGLEEWVPQPLPRGTYRLVIRTPLVGPGGDLVTTTVVAEVR